VNGRELAIPDSPSKMRQWVSSVSSNAFVSGASSFPIYLHNLLRNYLALAVE
jgi:hypothetical protein